MKEVIEHIEGMDAAQLQELMSAIEARFSAIYPQWEVLYVALHKDPKLRQQEAANILQFIQKAEE